MRGSEVRNNLYHPLNDITSKVHFWLKGFTEGGGLKCGPRVTVFQPLFWNNSDLLFFYDSEGWLGGSAGFGGTHLCDCFQLDGQPGWKAQDGLSHLTGWGWLLATRSDLDAFLNFFTCQAREAFLHGDLWTLVQKAKAEATGPLEVLALELAQCLFHHISLLKMSHEASADSHWRQLIC